MIKQEDMELKIMSLLDYELNKYVRSYGVRRIRIDRNQLYRLVADQLGVHFVMVRKVARQLLCDYVEKYQILNGTLSLTSDYSKRHSNLKEV